MDRFGCDRGRRDPRVLRRFSLLMQATPWREELSGLALIAALGVRVLVILAIGLVATFISMHDRFIDFAGQASRIADRVCA